MGGESVRGGACPVRRQACICKENSSHIGVTNRILGAEVPELKAESFRVALEGSQIFPSSQL